MDNLEGFILTGGASSRMGRDKAKLRLRDKTFIELAAKSLYAITDERISLVGNLPFDSLRIEISANKIYDLPVVADIIVKNSPAALVGLHAAIARAKRTHAAILACDLPFVTEDLLEKLAVLAAENNFDAVVPVQPDGRAQPLCAIYRCAICLPFIEEMLRGDDWSLRGFLDRVNTLFVEFKQLSNLPNSELFFLNVNTPADFLAAQKIAASENSWQK